MDIKLIITFILVPIASIVGSYFTAKTKTAKELIKKAKDEQKKDDDIILIKSDIQGLKDKVEKLDEHREETNITLVEIKGNQINMQDKQAETQGMVSKIYSLLLKSK